MASTEKVNPSGAAGQSVRPYETLSGLVASFASCEERDAIVEFRRDGTDHVTYAELARRIVQTARGLHAAGTTRGERVVLLGPNTLEWIVAYFGIVTAGGVAVPLDPQGSLDGNAAAIARIAPRAIITTQARRAQLEPLVEPGVRFWLLDGSGEDGTAALRAAAPPVALPAVVGGDMAALLFTSGTTGTPKAVALTHANFVANLTDLLAARLMSPADRVLLPLPLHHTYPFTVGLLTPLATGATVVLPAGISGPEILDACAAGRATALLAVPRLCMALWDGLEAAVRARGKLAERAFRALLRFAIAVRRRTGIRLGRSLFRDAHARFGGALELVGCGGAKLPTQLAWNLEGLGFRVLTGYGLTETSPVLTFNSPQQSRLGSEGRPLPRVELRIAPTSVAEAGEVEVRGPSVFAGYWNDAPATAATFTADGWFRTGDLGRIDEQGYLHVVGRSKELIVLADGKKFFPESVEKAYAQSPLLKELGVFERAGRLAAVVVPNEAEVRARGALRETAALRDALEDVSSRLPPHQRISDYRIVREALPRTQLGKLRRHLLPKLYDGGENRPAERAQLSDADRAVLAAPRAAAVWRWLLQRFPDRDLSLDTSPQLDLKIDSLEWVALTVDLERQLDVTLRAEQLARILTLRDLLREVDTASASTATAPPHAPAAFAEPGPALRALGALLLFAVRAAVRLLLRPTVTGVNRLPEGPVLITPNHASYLDPLVIAAALPWRQLRRTYWAGWAGVMHTSALRRLVSRATRVFPVDADRDLAAAVRTAQKLLQDGNNVVWFPEGRRSPDGRLQPFMPGVGAVLQGAAAAVVPAAITGTFAAWPKQRRWPRFAPIAVTFGEPLTMNGSEPPGAVGSRLERAVEELLGPSSGAQHTTEKEKIA